MAICDKCSGTGKESYTESFEAGFEKSGYRAAIRICQQCAGTGQVKRFDYEGQCDACEGRRTVAGPVVGRYPSGMEKRAIVQCPRCQGTGRAKFWSYLPDYS